ncbi:hypothetical protein MPL3356_310056 [Mesorhizobium plurifarium]|uniref:Uncharacterized protein n=1 Tax=Mesorhizobium plurifarium TaxID=69974 RepID=A0A090DZN8_MESPL|nr:hypothetical protein MPL3356_310056 [Mesorhizobium plurifarium]
MTGRDDVAPRIDTSRPPPFHEMNESSKAFERMRVCLLGLDGRFKDAHLFGLGGAAQYRIDRDVKDL